jgi:thioredoxin:protein disulfide reductase
MLTSRFSSHCLTLLRTVLCILSLSIPALHAANPLQSSQLLNPEEAFQLHAISSPDAQSINIQFTIAQGYYLYRDRIKIQAQGFTLTPPTFPKGLNKHDENFGNVEIFRNQLNFSIVLPKPVPANSQLTIRSQGCADVGVCYPPVTTKLSIDALLQGKLSSPEQPKTFKKLFQLSQ